MLLENPASVLPFKQWLLNDKENRRLLLFALIVIAIQFAWLKILYPFPNFMPPDSYSYLEAASKNQNINFWPIGYSRFLRLVSCFSNSHFVLVLLQYLLLQASLLYLLFSIRYWLSPGKWLFRILLGLSIMNPLLGHISNFVSSDALFTMLSIVWFTQLIWIMHKPNNRLLWAHGFIILLAVMVRHNALYYPFISTFLILFTRLSAKTKWLSVGRMFLLLLLFMGHTQYHYYKETGKVQYSAFAGWQMAANALYGYAYAELDSPKTVPLKFRKLHEITNQHMDSLRHVRNRPDKEVSIYYLWNEKAPLIKFVRYQWKKDSTSSGFKQWASMGPLYSAYGRYLTKKHPGPFLKYYLWPNFINYYAPPTKFMGMYNQKKSTVDPIAVSWFGWKNNRLPAFYADRKIIITEYFSILMAIINLVYIAGFIGFVIMTGLRRSISHGHGIAWWVTLIWFSNMVFSVFSAPIELRYQLFPMVFTLAFGTAFIELIIRSGRQIIPSFIQHNQIPPIPEPIL